MNLNLLKDEIINLYELEVTSIEIVPREDRRPCYIINTDKGKYFVKVYDEIDKYVIEGLKLLEYLNSKGYPAVNVIKSKRNNFIEVIDNIIISLFEYVEGERVKENSINEKKAINLGKALGLLHKLTENYNFPENPEGPTTIQKTLSGLYMYKKFVEKLPEGYKRIYTKLIEELENMELNSSKSVVHGEFTFEHVFFKGNEVYKVIDWDNVNYSYRVLDLGITLTFILLGFGEKYMKNIIRGYRKVKEIDEKELRKGLIYGIATFTWWYTSDCYLRIYNCEEYPKEVVENILERKNII